jgi:hypothetical protein
MDLLLACMNELAEARSTPPEWWMWSRDTTLALTLGLGAPTAALTAVSIYRWARATKGLQRAVVLALGAGIGLLIGLAALFAPTFPPLTLTPPLLFVSLRVLIARLGYGGDTRVKDYSPVKEMAAAAACAG